MIQIDAFSAVAAGRSGFRLILRGRAFKSRSCSTLHVCEDAEHILIPCRGAGHLSVDVYKAPSASRIVLYIPPSPVAALRERGKPTNVGANIVRDDAIARRLRDAANATVIRINYRSGSQTVIKSSSVSTTGAGDKTESPEVQHIWPTPIHDVTTAFDWILQNVVPNTTKNTSKNPTGLGIYGALDGGSLALALAMTECRVDAKVRISAVATNDAVVDWVSVPDGISSNILSRVKAAIFPSPATHPGSPFDPFASPIHFLRTPTRGVPLTAAQQASRDAEALGEDFRDMETLDDLIAQESWIDDGPSTISVRNHFITETLAEDTIENLIDNFSALQTLNDGHGATAQMNAPPEAEDLECDEWDERRANEDYAEVMHEMAVAEASRKSSVAQELYVEQTGQVTSSKSQKRNTRKGSDTNGATLMRHRKWPPSSPSLQIPHFRLAASAPGDMEPTADMSVLVSQNEDMARLLRRAVSRDLLAVVRGNRSSPESRGRPSDDSPSDEGNIGDWTGPEANQMETIKNLVEERVQMIREATQTDNGTYAIDLIGEWFRKHL